MRGQRVLNYLLEEPLGVGGFGAVWTARHHLTEELVAAKVLSRPPGSGTLEALRDEALLLHTLDRAWSSAGRPAPPPFVRFVDVGELGGQAVILTELLRGRDLWTVLEADRRPWPVEAAAGLLAALLDALHFAHELDIIHRDIKPENLFLEPVGSGVRLRVLDLGIAKVLQEREGEKSQVMGSVRYMAPERYRGRTSPRVDLYGAGLIAWELLAGKQACPSDDPAVAMRWHVKIGAKAIRELRADVPPGLAAVVDGLCQRAPRDRLPSAAAALAGLAGLRPPTGALLALPVEVPVPELGRDPVPSGPSALGSGAPPTSVPPVSGELWSAAPAPSAPTLDPDSLAGAPPPAPPAPERASRWLTNALLAGILGLMVLGCAGSIGVTLFGYGLSAWMTVRSEDMVDEARQDGAKRMVEGTAHGIREYSKAMGRPPRDLEELGMEGVLDPWGHALVYRVKGRSWSIRSLGKDGKAGGRGLDKDIVAKGP
jgi:serine/threonine protein kinase